MNCRTNGLPPAYVYMMFNSNSTADGPINVTEELEKEVKIAQFTRFVKT